jgi:hypothetical protein
MALIRRCYNTLFLLKNARIARSWYNTPRSFRVNERLEVDSGYRLCGDFFSMILTEEYLIVKCEAGLPAFD